MQHDRQVWRDHAWQGIHRGEKEQRQKLERAFLAIIWSVTSSRFLTGGLWAVKAESATIPCIPCETCTVCEICNRQ